MKFYSTNRKSPEVSLREAVLRGMPHDKGLYMPVRIPRLPEGEIRRFSEMSLQDIAYQVARRLLEDELPEKVLQTIIRDSLTFDAPLVRLDEHLYVLELFHGPTLAFKDFAARFMAKLMGYYVEASDRELYILVATSGDTGSAVANGFLNVPGIRVIVLYPGKKVSFIQEQQLTTLGHNITALEIEGTFDDCQNIVKLAFLDPELQETVPLTSANSINISRLIPQSFYYFYALACLEPLAKPPVISVPSGNLGNLTAGLIAKKMGLPVEKFIAATNINDVVPAYLHTGTFTPKPSQKTLTNAMDVGNPSNFTRILALYEHDVQHIRRDIEGHAFPDSETIRAINRVFHDHGYILDPHGAVGYLGLQKYLQEHHRKVTGLFFETAHPAKFPEVVENAIQQPVEIPSRLKECLNKPKQAIHLPGDFKTFKAWLLGL